MCGSWLAGYFTGVLMHLPYLAALQNADKLGKMGVFFMTWF